MHLHYTLFVSVHGHGVQFWGCRTEVGLMQVLISNAAMPLDLQHPKFFLSITHPTPGFGGGGIGLHMC